jgi:hypothetical protein
VALGLGGPDGLFGPTAALDQPLQGLSALRQEIERLPLGRVERADHAVARHGVELDARELAQGAHPLRPQPRNLVRRGLQGGVEAGFLVSRLRDRLLDRGERLPSGDHAAGHGPTTSGSRRREPA